MTYERKEIPAADILDQEDICREIFDIVTADGKRPLAMVDTYGCQQNEADSEKLRGYLALMGYGFTQDEFQADVVVVNTCAVREHAEMRVLGNVGALTHTKAKKPGQIIAVCGCMGALGKKVRNGDGIDAGRIQPQPFCHEQPVEISTHGKADGRP